MAKIYLAARYSRREELLGYTKELENLGHTVTSRWITGCHELPGKGDGNGRNAYTEAERCVFAKEDLKDIEEADTLIAFTEKPTDRTTNRGGRHVEFGIGIALELDLYVVGPRENVFHCLPEVEAFPSWDYLVDYLGDAG